MHQSPLFVGLKVRIHRSRDSTLHLLMERDQGVTLTVQSAEGLSEMTKVFDALANGDFLSSTHGFRDRACCLRKDSSQAHGPAFWKVALFDTEQIRPEVDTNRDGLCDAVDALGRSTFVAWNLFFGDQTAPFQFLEVFVDGGLADLEKLCELHWVVRFTNKTFENAPTHLVLNQAEGRRRVTHLLNQWFNSRGLL